MNLQQTSNAVSIQWLRCEEILCLSDVFSVSATKPLNPKLMFKYQTSVIAKQSPVYLTGSYFDTTLLQHCHPELLCQTVTKQHEEKITFKRQILFFLFCSHPPSLLYLKFFELFCTFSQKYCLTMWFVKNKQIAVSGVIVGLCNTPEALL